MTFNDAIKVLQIDYEQTLNRFSGNLDLLKHFILSFPEDKTFNQLQDAIQAKDWKAIEVATHTLKGVSGNLGFSSLFQYSADLVLAIRNKEYEKAEALIPTVVKTCQDIIDTITQIQ
ncbi:MAG: Hpt domain-containing protein [Treponema sp.]|nr:Hpt domain-containing protein [Treponema sp.]